MFLKSFVEVYAACSNLCSVVEFECTRVLSRFVEFNVVTWNKVVSVGLEFVFEFPAKKRGTHSICKSSSVGAATEAATRGVHHLRTSKE